MKLVIAVLVMTVTVSYGQSTNLLTTEKNQGTTNRWEVDFWRIPCCGTTYSLVGHQAENAVPAVLKALDHFSGETNAAIRCEIIRGALYRSEYCTNVHFQVIIQKGTNDPSESVRSQTTNMVARAIKRMKQAERAGPLPRDPQSGHSDGER